MYACFSRYCALRDRNWQFLCFAFEGRTYQFHVLPFGLSLSPQIFTRCIAAALSPVQEKRDLPRSLSGRLDWLICSVICEQAAHKTTCLLTYVAHLGLTVNLSKSCLIHSLQVIFIGIAFDSVALTASPSPQQVSDILGFLRLLGKLAAASFVVPLGVLSQRPLQVWINSIGLDHKAHQSRMNVLELRAVHLVLRHFVSGPSSLSLQRLW